MTVSDAVTVLQVIFGERATPLPCGDGSLEHQANRTILDLNDDARVDIADVLYLLGYVFLDGPAPSLGERCVPVEDCPNACAP